jgi:Ca-activated chloride channel family protein
MVFVLDCSGSMNGQPIAQAKKAVERALRNMQPDDTFQLVRFSMGASQLGTSPVPATPDNIRRGLAYLESLEGEGGTMMVEGIKAALDFPHDPKRLRFVSFLTDGYIGNEAEILREIHTRLGASRIFSFGVGQSTNRFLLDGMAKMGNGAVAYVSLNENAGEIMDLFFDRISHPAMTDIAVNWGGMQVSDVFPSRMPDLFVGRPVIVTGRFTGTPSASVTIHGQTGEKPVDMIVPIDLADASATHAGLPAVWARTKIADLADRSLYTDGTELPGAVKQVALEYGLMSAYTAFVAVDSLTRTAGDHGTTVNVAVPVPEGVKYETAVQER